MSCYITRHNYSAGLEFQSFRGGKRLDPGNRRLKEGAKMSEIFAEVHSRDPRLGSIGRSAKVATAQPSSWQSEHRR